jgi:CBS-domain-containing membrane protein
MSKQAILQSLYALVIIFGLVYLLDLNDIVIISSIGASSFILFAKPHSNPAKTWNFVGGQLIGLFVGSLFGAVPYNHAVMKPLVYALCVAVTIFAMVILGREHPPAAGTALSVVLAGFSLDQIISLVVSVLVLAFMHHLLRSRMVDLV